MSKHGLAKEMSKRENSVDGDGMSLLLSFADGGKSLMKEGGQESREF